MMLRFILLALWAFCGVKALFPTHEALKLVPGNAQQGDQFGTIVAASGNLVVSTSTQLLNGGSGIAYIYDCSSASHCILAQQINSPVNVAAEQFGFFAAASESGHLLILSAMTPDNTGKAYIYTCPTPFHCQQQSIITLPDPQAGDQFGFYIWAQRNRVLIGAPGRNGVGAAYLYDCSNPVQCKLLASFSPENGTPGGLFGDSLGFFGDLVAIGASAADGTGAVYVYECDHHNRDRDRDRDCHCHCDCDRQHCKPPLCHQIAKLSPPAGTNQQANFGLYVVVEGRRVYTTADNFTQIGLAFVYECPKGHCGCQLASTFSAPNLQVNDQFGAFLAVNGFEVVVTAQNHAESGAAYVYNCRNPANCELERYLLPSDGAPGDLFGATTNFGAHELLITAPSKNNNTGALYTFNKSGKKQRHECGCE